MSKAYIVTSGYYSDYHIKKVFLDEKKAKKYLEILNDIEARIEEYSISNIECEKNKTLWIQYNMELNRIEASMFSVSNNIDFEAYTNYSSKNNYGNYYETLYLTRQLRENETEEQATERIMKISQDISAEIKYELSNGATIDEINKMLEVKFNDEK